MQIVFETMATIEDVILGLESLGRRQLVFRTQSEEDERQLFALMSRLNSGQPVAVTLRPLRNEEL